MYDSKALSLSHILRFCSYNLSFASCAINLYQLHHLTLITYNTKHERKKNIDLFGPVVYALFFYSSCFCFFLFCYLHVISFRMYSQCARNNDLKGETSHTQNETYLRSLKY